jgi:uncharacterized protein (DUF433 family)
MSNAIKNIMLRVISKRMVKEEIEEIFSDYPRLTDEDKKEIREALIISAKNTKNETDNQEKTKSTI